MSFGGHKHLFLLSIYLGVEVLLIGMFVLSRYRQTLFQSGYIPIRMGESFSCTTSSPTVDIVQHLNFSH